MAASAAAYVVPSVSLGQLQLTAEVCNMYTEQSVHVESGV